MMHPSLQACYNMFKDVAKTLQIGSRIPQLEENNILLMNYKGIQKIYKSKNIKYMKTLWSSS